MSLTRIITVFIAFHEYHYMYNLTIVTPFVTDTAIIILSVIIANMLTG